MTMRVYLTGRVCIELDGDLAVTERSFRGRQERLAFAHLVLERGRPIPRLDLAAVLWPDQAPEAWTASLSAVVSRLRSMLAAPALRAAGAALTSGFGQYQLQLPHGVWVDVEAAAGAVDRAEAALRAGDTRGAFAPCVVASSIAQRPFLSGDGGPWVDAVRARLARYRLRALESLARVCLAAGDAPLALEAASDAVAIDPLRESAHRLMMEAHALAGNSARAVRAYHDLRDRLVAELGADPSSETEALYLELLR